MNKQSNKKETSIPVVRNLKSNGRCPVKPGKLGLLLLLLCVHVIALCQQPVNPSFEGPRGVALTPMGWIPYGEASSPDTQPGAWQVNLKPSHGSSYISMVCRGYSIIDSYKWESMQQPLTSPLLWGESYAYSIDLAHSPAFIADTIRFDQPAKLRIWGMNEMNQKELLWESDAIANTNWETIYFTLTPSMRTPYLVLEAYYIKPEKYCGNILIDNMVYYPNGNPADQVVDHPKDTLSHPNDSMSHPDTITSHPELVSGSNHDTLVTLNNDGLPEQIDGREVHQSKELMFRGDQLTITIWDNRTTDGDIVSLFLNGKRILKEYEISKEKFDLTVDVEENQTYYLSLYAHNLGKIPPNTVAMYISDGERKKFLTLSSDLEKCEAVELEIKEPIDLVDNGQ